jgi:hypothetical protein
MSSFGLWRPQLRIKHHRTLFALIVLIHLFALLAIIPLHQLPPWLRGLLMSTLLINSGVQYYRIFFADKAPAFIALEANDRSWRFIQRNGTRRFGLHLNTAYISRYLICLRFNGEPWLLLFRDALEKDDFRRLYVFLRFYPLSWEVVSEDEGDG